MLRLRTPAVLLAQLCGQGLSRGIQTERYLVAYAQRARAARLLRPEFCLIMNQQSIETRLIFMSQKQGRAVGVADPVMLEM
ncbi:hypothetical protein BKA62DRAFT_696145 [Auriculariales sp. MPI-PUGE-AT-0066]|nr:hypothetical protein BKA62DRAFT_696145 [Auriculariales sp. MPI-PUGE-AT-0066]